jgi:hypothetical protein
MIADAIRETDTEHEIYSLLTAYIEAVRYGGELDLLSEPLTSLPITGPDDIRARSAILIAELDSASKRLDDKACAVIKEALVIFGAALNRFELLGHGSPQENLKPRLDVRFDLFGRNSEINSFKVF